MLQKYQNSRNKFSSPKRNGVIKMAKCPKCGYEGHNHVYHWGTGEIECDRCRHDYVPESRSSKKQEQPFSFPFNAKAHTFYALSNDVWLLPYGKTSVGIKAIGSKHIGQVINGEVVDHHNNVIGSIDLMGHFEPLRW